MSPLTKIIQIFALIILLYTAAGYMLFIRRTHLFTGRGLLMLGMIAYGAGIGLIAQVYHISSHPTNAVMVWLLGVLAVSMVMREKWGYYLALLLALIWHSWEYFEYDNPGYVAIVFPLLLGFLFYKERVSVGLLLSFLQGLLWWYMTNAHWIADSADNTSDQAVLFAFTLLHIPLGLFCYALARWAEDTDRDFLKVPAMLVRFMAWLFIVAPLFILSWPYDEGHFNLYAERSDLRLTIQFWLLSIVGGGMLFHFFYKRNESEPLIIGVSIFSILMFLLPLGNTAVLLSATHLGIVLLVGGLLYFPFADKSDGRIEKAFAIIYILAVLLVKGIGLFAYGLSTEHYYIAYGTGFIIFAGVIFLINQFVRDALIDSDKTILNRYPGGYITAVIAFLVFIMLYALSFRMTEQYSIFRAGAPVLILIFLFLGLTIALYVILFYRKAELLPLATSGAILFFAVFALFLSNPNVPWQVYSVLFNFQLFVFAAVLIYYSTRIKSIALANLALAGLVAQVITRYFDLFWDLLSGSALFITTGVVVFIGGYLLERNRRRLIEAIEADRPTDGHGGITGGRS
ncbi:MAG: DUF2157 domain-containing protein, partial [Leptospiraceae bacterium]|nr:DUF2157 domain-containing protein [Leptospiraceae bacterium]